MNLIQNHKESRDEDMVNVSEHGDIERVLSQQHIGESVLTAYLQHAPTYSKLINGECVC